VNDPAAHPIMPDTRDLFRARGLRVTRQREVIFDALRATTAHPTAEELFASVSSAVESDLSLATVYNTLEALCEAGLARRMPCRVGHGPSRYDADVSDHIHVALPDGRVVDVPADISTAILAAVSPDVLARIEQATGTRIERVHVELVGRPEGADPATSENPRSGPR
jgi:Fe2+ or Zn2+ uptake regulation protein